MHNRKRVVITGIGTINPLSNNAQNTWEMVVNGESGIGPITHFDAGGFKTQIAGEIKGFDPIALLGSKEARRTSRATQFALAAAGQAIEDAGLLSPGGDRDRIGVIIGSGMGSMDPIIDSTEILANRGPKRVSPFFIPMMLADTPAAVASINFGFTGPNMAIATACATGNNVIGEAAATITRGAADVMIAGGTEACILPLALAGFSIMGALSTRNEAPQKASRPFDKDRDGFVVSEGAAVLVLEELDHARTRGASIYGELLGYGSSSDATHISQPDPAGAGAARAMRAALRDAGLEAEDIDYINAHGTGTAMNDKAETMAIKRAFGDQAYEIPVSSTKSSHGHLLGAAGTLEAIICLQSLRHHHIPPTINLETADPECDLDYVPNKARPANLNVVMSNGFGLGGHNATIILGTAPANPKQLQDSPNL